jgi:hypothetical protein
MLTQRGENTNYYPEINFYKNINLTFVLSLNLKKDSFALQKKRQLQCLKDLVIVDHHGRILFLILAKHKCRETKVTFGNFIA